MRSFRHWNPPTIEEACAVLAEYDGRAKLNAGGSDLLGVLKDDIHADYPEAIVNLKAVAGLKSIRELDGGLAVGALTTLADLARSSLVGERFPALAQAAYSVGTPQIRTVATLGGNLCQEVRCWYYRYPRHVGGPVSCLRKGARGCPAATGDHRYHAIMGAKGCIAVCPSDTATALAALDATLLIAGVRGKRELAVEDLYETLGLALDPDEVIAEVRLPAPRAAVRQAFVRFTLRDPVDFAVVSAAAAVGFVDGVCVDPRIVLGAVAAAPFRAAAADEYLNGRPLDEEAIEGTADAAVADARPLRGNAYKVQIARELVRRALRTLGGEDS